MTTPTGASDHDDVPLLALLLATRGTPTGMIQRAQAKIGFADVPASGEPILSAVEWSGAAFESVVLQLGVTKQAVSQTVETFVSRGYLERTRDPSDRRRVNLSLAERDTPLGRVRRLAPAVHFSRTPGSWDDPILTPMGSAAPAWLGTP